MSPFPKYCHICSTLSQFIDCTGDLELFNENLSLSAEIHLRTIATFSPVTKLSDPQNEFHGGSFAVP